MEYVVTASHLYKKYKHFKACSFRTVWVWQNNIAFVAGRIGSRYKRRDIVLWRRYYEKRVSKSSTQSCFFCFSSI